VTNTANVKLPPAVILAGGLGKRLRSAYAAGPKSMAPIAGKPFIDYLLRWLRAEGVEEVVICVGYKRSSIQRYVGKGRKWGLRVSYSIERKLLGTAGAVKNAEPLISSRRVLVLNGDTLVGVKLKSLVEFHQSRPAWATLTTVKVPDQQRYGRIKLDDSSRIMAFLEKEGSSNQDASKTILISGGVYVFEKDVLAAIQSDRPASLEKEVFPKLAAHRRTYGFVTDAPFIDIGVPEDFRRAQSELHERFCLCNSH